MFIQVYQGQVFSYSYEADTGHYMLFDNNYKTHVYLHGEDAEIFREQIERIDNMPPPQNNNGSLIENIISIYLLK